MSMLESFFDIRKDSRKLFEGLEITKNQALCDEWMNQYPTIFVSFRQVDGLNFTGAYDMPRMLIDNICTFCAKALFLELCVYYKTLAGKLHPRTC